MPEHPIRHATSADAPAIGQLLHDFNVEYEDVTPGAERLAQRMRELLPSADTDVLLGGSGPDGIAVMRFRPSIWTPALECYLAELYVTPARRGNGLGRALMKATIEHARAKGATHIDLNTGESDIAARSLYESLGFSNSEGRPEGPVNYYYELEL